jgi:hypothetical protein
MLRPSRTAFMTRMCVVLTVFATLPVLATPQAAGNSASIQGTVLDPTGAAVPNATVEIRNPVSQFDRTTSTDANGAFAFTNIPFNPYHLTIAAQGFAPYVQDVELRSSVPVTISAQLQIAGSSTTVTVEAESGDLIENDSTFHTDVDRNLSDKMPLESRSSAVNSLVTLATPGISADSNGLFHGLGDHAENSFSVDGQPITDQQSKVFSNQIPLDAIQSMEVISGAPPAEYGDKTSVVIDVTTRSGLGVTTPHGTVTASYGSFGTTNGSFDVADGGKNWGNYISASALQSGRFLDPPEFAVMHDKGNQENVFDRVDYQISSGDSVHLNMGFTRSWFETPNSFDAQYATQWAAAGGVGPNGEVVGPTDQHSQIKTFNIAPSWTRLISSTSVFTLGAFVRRDQYNYYPSSNPFADLGPPNLQRETVSQGRNLTNAGLRSDLSYVKGIHNVKVGAVYQQTFLNENDRLGIVDPTFLPSLTDANGVPCYDSITHQAVDAPCTDLIPYDLTQRAGGTLFGFNGHTDVKELALYVDDNITKGNWNLRVGLRGDFYNGLTTHKEAEPRIGIAYHVKASNTVLRVSYARVLETPFNENLVLASTGCDSPVLNPLLGCLEAAQATPLSPGWRNEFHAGLEQAFGKYLVFSGEYIWKYTHNAFDFSVLGNTPITFPIEWDRSKIPGFAGRISMPNYHGISAQVVFSSVAARFFTPQIGGAGAVPSTVLGGGSLPFRIDHDEKFNQATHVQYQPWKNGPWVGFNWRYDNGMVAGQTPCYGGNCAQTTTEPSGAPAVAMTDSFGVPLTADQEFQSGLFCGSQRATPFAPLPNPCPLSQYGSTLLQVPAPSTENDDKNPARIAPRSLFDLAIGHDNINHGDRYKIGVQLTAINITNKYALYNFLSTFSGTHYVTPRALTAEVTLRF